MTERKRGEERIKNKINEKKLQKQDGWVHKKRLNVIVYVFNLFRYAQKQKALGASGNRTPDLSHPKRESYH
jgi:hypothetical protein